MTELLDKSKMPYGKYKDKRMVDIPDSYFIWLYKNEKCSPSVKIYIEDCFNESDLKY